MAIEDVVDHNFPYVISEEKGGMIYAVRKKFNGRITEQFLDKPCISVGFFYDPQHGMIMSVEGDNHYDVDFENLKAGCGAGSYKFGYTIKMIGEIVGSSCDNKATNNAKMAIRATMDAFNDSYANKFPHNMDLTPRREVTGEQTKPFSRTEATRGINHALKKHRAHTAR